MELGYSIFHSASGILWHPVEVAVGWRNIRKIYRKDFLSDDTAISDIGGEWICRPHFEWCPRIPCHICRYCELAIFHYGKHETKP